MLFNRHSLFVLFAILAFSVQADFCSAATVPVMPPNNSCTWLLIASLQDEDEQEEGGKHKHGEGEHEHSHQDEHKHGDHDDGHEHGEHQQDDHDDHEHHDDLERAEEELEIRMMEIEIQAKELQFHRLELGRVFELTSDKNKTAFFAIMQCREMMEHDDAIELLKSCLDESTDDHLKRVIRLQLAMLSAESDNADDAKKYMKSLILGK